MRPFLCKLGPGGESTAPLRMTKAILYTNKKKGNDKDNDKSKDKDNNSDDHKDKDKGEGKDNHNYKTETKKVKDQKDNNLTGASTFG